MQSPGIVLPAVERFEERLASGRATDVADQQVILRARPIDEFDQAVKVRHSYRALIALLGCSRAERDRCKSRQDHQRSEPLDSPVAH